MIATNPQYSTSLAVVALSRILRDQYVSPHPRVPLNVLGELMWIRVAAFSYERPDKLRSIFGKKLERLPRNDPASELQQLAPALRGAHTYLWF